MLGTDEPHILVVDDERGILDSLEKIYKREGYQVSTTDSGALNGALQPLLRPVTTLTRPVESPGSDLQTSHGAEAGSCRCRRVLLLAV